MIGGVNLGKMIADDIINSQNSSVIGVFEFLINLELEVRLQVPDILLLLQSSLDLIFYRWREHIEALESINHVSVDWSKFHRGPCVILIIFIIANFNYRRISLLKQVKLQVINSIADYFMMRTSHTR
jgi:hypothetical protein